MALCNIPSSLSIRLVKVGKLLRTAAVGVRNRVRTPGFSIKRPLCDQLGTFCILTLNDSS